MSFAVSPYYPSTSKTLLLKTALHPSEDVARAAWSQWEAEQDFDALTWSELRLCPAASTRLSALGITTPLMPRLVGIKRLLWLRRQRQLAAARPALKAFDEAGIVPMVIKGTAVVALDRRSVAERFSHDIDLVVPNGHWETAVGLLIDRGLQPSVPRKAIETRMRAWRHSVDFKNADVEIDLHQSALFLNRCVGDDDAMRARAAPSSLLRQTVLVPSAADQLVIAMCHGLHFDPAAPADWALDAAFALRTPDLDWQTLVAETKARGLAAFATVGLAFLAEELGQAVPDAVRATIAEDVAPHFREEFHSNFHFYKPWSAHAAAACYFADVDRAERAAARRPPPEACAAPSTEWRIPDAGAHGVRLQVPDLVDPRRDLRLELRLPPMRSLFRRRLHFDLRCNYQIECIVLEWEERPGRRLQERIVPVIIPGAFLRLREVRELRLAGRWDGPFGNRRRVSLDALRYRWRELT